LGARRHLYDKISGSDTWAQMEAERQAGNHTIQSSACEQMKLAVNRVYSRGIYERYAGSFVWPVHDQTDSLCPIENAVGFVMEKHTAMTELYADMPFKIKSEVSIGKNFGELVAVGTDPTPEKIEEVLLQIFKEQSK
jgi:DNA polymerase I-like protein with 3'-5' exonuclease and polymerase domains